MDQLLYDATLPLHPGTILFPGDPAFELVNLFGREKGDSFELARIIMGTHAGTHVDAPKHFLDGGASVDEIPLHVLVGPGAVVDLRGEPVIDEERLERIHGVDRVLFKTDNGPLLSRGRFQEEFVLSHRGRCTCADRKGGEARRHRLPHHRKTLPFRRTRASHAFAGRHRDPRVCILAGSPPRAL